MLAFLTADSPHRAHRKPERWTGELADADLQKVAGAGETCVATVAVAVDDCERPDEWRGGGRDRTRADAVLETAALPLSYTPSERSVIPGRREASPQSMLTVRGMDWRCPRCPGPGWTAQKWSLGTESNRRPPDSHSGVLATELPQGLVPVG